MNFRKIVMLYGVLAVSLTTLACQKGGNYGHYDRKISKKDLRVGSDLNQRRKQVAWELLQTKKANKICEPQDLNLLSQYVQFNEIMPSKRLPSEFRISSCIRLPKAVALFTILCMMMPSCTALNPVRYDCVNMQNRIDFYRQKFLSIKEFANEHKDVLGDINFPEVVQLHCPPLDLEDRHWRDDHAYEWYHKGKAFLEEFEQKRQELNKRMTKYKVHNEVKSVYDYMDGKIFNIKPEYAKSFEAYIKDPKAFASRSQSELDEDPLVKVGAIIQAYEKNLEFERSVHHMPWDYMKSRFLSIMQSKSEYVAIAKEIIGELATGTYASEIKTHAEQVDADIKKGLVDPVHIAGELNYLIDMAGRNVVDLARLTARLDEPSLGLLYAGQSVSTRMPGMLIMCSKEGICGITDGVTALLGGAKSDFVSVDAYLKNMSGYIMSAQNVRRLFMYGGRYVGRPYVTESGPVNPLVRSLDGGRQAAHEVFKFCARGNEIVESYSPESSSTIYKVVLDDGTKVSYWPTTKNGYSVIKISDVPLWICPDTLEFRFS